MARCRTWFTANFSGTEGALCHISALIFAAAEGVNLASTYWPGNLGSVALSAGLLSATEMGLCLARRLLRRLLGHGLGWLMGLGLLIFAVTTTVAGGAGEGWTWRVYLFSGLADYRAAKAALNELLDGEKLPKMDALKEKRRKLAARKKALYAEYRAAQQEMREAVAVKANIDHLLGLSDERKNKEQER